MKPLIVCRERPTRMALECQFQQRGRGFHSVAPNCLATGFGADPADAVVVDAASLDAVREGAGDPFDEAAFQHLVEHCRRLDLPLLLISDSRVFAPAPKQRYRESDERRPHSPAGQRLLARERHLAERLERHMILRIGPPIAAAGSNLLTHLLAAFRHGGSVPVATEPRFCPTPLADVARVVSGMLDQLDCGAPAWGAFHYHSGDAASCYEFAEVVLAAAAQYWDLGGERVHLQAAGGEPWGGVYPLLNCQRIRDTFGIQQLPWRRAIPELLKQVYEGERA